MTVEVDPLYFDQLLGAAVNVKHAFDLGRMDVINGTIRPRNTSLCHECITTVSSVWRSGPEGPRTLCNACGLRYYKQNQRRTVEAKRRESKDVADAAASLAALGSVSMKAVESLIAKNDFATSCNKRKRSIVSGSNEYSDDDDENDDDDDEVYDDDDENDDEEDDGYIGTQRKVASDKGGGSRHEDKSFRGETGLAGAASPQHSPGVVTLPSIANICDLRRSKAVQQAMKDRVQRTGDFILRKLTQKKHIYAAAQSTLDEQRRPAPPLVVGINGAQGSGKTTLVRGLVEFLQARNISTAGFSLDDIYWTHRQQTTLAQAHRDNPLLQFRGQPGTHDVDLGHETLAALLRNDAEVEIPAYDKSLNGGYGDRVPRSQWHKASPPVDVVLFEGWCLGFRALDDQEFARFVHEVRRPGGSALHKHSRKYSDDNLQRINENLVAYEKLLYPQIDAWVYMRVSDADVVYRWRKEQEDELAATGRPSLSDKQLEDLVTRFLPGYEMALEKLDKQGFVSSSVLPAPDTLRMHLDLERNVVAWDHKF
ncbi:hypothetical protein EV174_000697 [Coemansia sp. RSA 2320]|nr:hypothetical protein EV174_000697 [Coemansia sp. RSA 2320]